ncbi:hypothetical protein OC846_003759 [Tilletia horrida]|uniref:Ubiquitin 3 binding protein But2 C-terminal domain-containing protein n=1 Tax=Tilletia horrida TaxID=155126 RepID=A0AAN6GPX2_9BASI|nr:hypothetical protein OC845_005248 [Tilletia horrida]KAK0550209.1 hypothetical protein OC846_003759 [Tilletia horrida]KAK0565005.1 hypothetical protein OC861_003990 [Tilletia horrida]
MFGTTLASTAAAALLFVASAPGAAAASAIEPRADTLQCGSPLVVSSITQLGASTGNKRPVAFQTAKDSKGRLQLSTSVNGVAASTSPTFEFVPCQSKFLHSGYHQYEQSPGLFTNFTYGLLRPSGHPDKCVTAASIAANGKNYPLVSAPCTTVDSVETLAPQWWSAYYNSTHFSGMPYTIYFEGNDTLPGLWYFRNVASGKKRLVDVYYQTKFNGTEPFTLSLTGP